MAYSSSFQPIMVHLVWDEHLSFLNSFLLGDDSSKRTCFPLRNKIDFSTMVDIAYKYVGVDKEFCKLNFFFYGTNLMAMYLKMKL